VPLVTTEKGTDKQTLVHGTHATRYSYHIKCNGVLGQCHPFKSEGTVTMGKIISINISRKKHVTKKPVREVELVVGMGIRDDAHAGPGDRQVSLLMMESVDKQRELIRRKLSEAEAEGKKRKDIELVPGIFAENFTTGGIDLLALKLGDELKVGEGIKLRVTKIGKECHTKCAIYHLVGECVMPLEGIFCEVLDGGKVRPGDDIERC